LSQRQTPTARHCPRATTKTHHAVKAHRRHADINTPGTRPLNANPPAPPTYQNNEAIVLAELPPLHDQLHHRVDTLRQRLLLGLHLLANEGQVGVRLERHLEGNVRRGAPHQPHKVKRLLGRNGIQAEVAGQLRVDLGCRVKAKRHLHVLVALRTTNQKKALGQRAHREQGVQTTHVRLELSQHTQSAEQTQSHEGQDNCRHTTPQASADARTGPITRPRTATVAPPPPVRSTPPNVPGRRQWSWGTQSPAS